ncbi:MAG: ABC transporter permease subunit [Planctomycetes bacterium]|nr:ABC transporter permease subunit [Planctomycetota bacterium]
MGREARFYAFGSLAYFVVLEALLIGAVLFWPDFEDNLEALRDMAPLQALKGMLDQIGAGGVAAYVNGQHFFKGCNTVGTLAAVIFAMNAVAGEAHRGTLELWLSRPVSRRRLLLERWVGGALAVVVPVFASTLSIPWLLGFVEAEMQLGPLLLGAAHQSLLLLAIYAAAFLWSCLTARPILIAFGMLLFTVLQFSVYLIQVATHWSLFRLTDIDVFVRIGATHALDGRICWPLAGVSAALLATALFVFERRTP